MQPITIQLAATFPPDSLGLDQFGGPLPGVYNLPANQRLVIESISAAGNLPPGQSMQLMMVVGPQKGNAYEYEYQIPLQYQASYNPLPTSPQSSLTDWYTMHHTVRIYVPMNSQVRLFGWRGPSFTGPGGDVKVTLNGYLEPVLVINFPGFPPFVFS